MAPSSREIYGRLRWVGWRRRRRKPSLGNSTDGLQGQVRSGPPVYRSQLHAPDPRAVRWEFQDDVPARSAAASRARCLGPAEEAGLRELGSDRVQSAQFTEAPARDRLRPVRPYRGEAHGTAPDRRLPVSYTHLRAHETRHDLV